MQIDATANEADLFIDEFQRENSMRREFNDNLLGHYTLRGSRRAFDEVIACQRSYINASDSGSDPFANSKSGKSDLFSE